jgi:hypothetical protein
VKIFVCANDAHLQDAIEQIRRVIPRAQIAGRLDGESVEPLPVHLRSAVQLGALKPVAPIARGDLVLDFASSAESPFDAASGVFFVHGDAFLKAAGVDPQSSKSYAHWLHDHGVVEESSQAYFQAMSDPHAIQAGARLVVNSFPKSGTIWLMAMIGKMLALPTDRHIYLTHVADIEIAAHSRNLCGCVGLVRDLRDVVLSWFHDVQRTDLQSGFSTPRYPTIEQFYFQYVLGKVNSSPQFYHGNLERWLDYLGARAVPIVRYEDLLSDPAQQLQRLANAWKFQVSEAMIKTAVANTRLESIAQNLSSGETYIAARLKSGHARTGVTGEWRTALPRDICRDIWHRFSGYMQRLGYHEEGDRYGPSPT